MRAILVEYQGKPCTFKELTKKTGLSYQTLLGRYHEGKRGNELAAPARRKPQKLYKYKGQMLTMEAIAAATGKSIGTIRYSYYRYGNFNYIDMPNQKSAKARVLCTIDSIAYKASDLTRMFGISRQAIHIHYHSKTKEEFKNWVIKKMSKMEKK